MSWKKEIICCLNWYNYRRIGKIKSVWFGLWKKGKCKTKSSCSIKKSKRSNESTWGFCHPKNNKKQSHNIKTYTIQTYIYISKSRMFYKVVHYSVCKILRSFNDTFLWILLICICSHHSTQNFANYHQNNNQY